MKTAAIYARVSSDQQKEEKTIASQTAALMEFARSEGYDVPAEWIFQDEGYSGANLVRPGLERVRDLAAEGQIQAVLVLSPDRLSRKYAYQVLLIEELARHGVQVLFVNAPKSDSPEDRLLLQFQGMIAEYERAQILERSRRGKRHRARQGEISVLSGAPYGYRYVRKSEERAGYYEVIEAEADVVRQAYAWYTRDGLSIGAVTRRLNELSVPTKKQGAQWQRSTLWAMLRNPAYKGTACFGKTQTGARQRSNTRALGGRASLPARVSASRELPREQWIEIAVPALIEADTFEAAQERLASNKQRSSRRTIEPSVLQGLLHCQECGHALYRSSSRSSARKIYYYRCLGSDAWRYSGSARCEERPIRQDLLDHIVWSELVRLIEDPSLIQAELSRRLEAARNANPAQRRQETLTGELAQTRKRMERLLTAYQEELLSLDELRGRMPELRRREQSLQAELEALRTQAADQATYLRLAQTLSTFLDSLRAKVKTLDVLDRQRIARLLLKEVVVGHAHIIIRHSIPNTFGASGGSPGGSYRPRSADGATSDNSYLLCPWREPAMSRASAGSRGPARANQRNTRVRTGCCNAPISAGVSAVASAKWTCPSSPPVNTPSITQQ